LTRNATEVKQILQLGITIIVKVVSRGTTSEKELFEIQLKLETFHIFVTDRTDKHLSSVLTQLKAFQTE
jgi:hypothetical protein